MAIVQITSQDPNLGFIIHKNPASGMQLRGIRQGTAFGWYSKENTSYNVLFKDADNAVSFGDQEFEYLNTSRYNSSVVILNIISEYFSSTVKTQSDLDVDGVEKSFTINMIDIRLRSQLVHFEKYFTDFQIESDNYVARSNKLKITTKKSFHHLFNYVNLLMLFITLTSDEFVLLDESSIEKYLGSIEKLDAPFFIRYLFSRNLLKSKKQFEKYKARLENIPNHKQVTMTFGDTAMQRRDAIQQMLSFDKPIIDIGCGEGAYAIPFSTKLGEKNYYAIDVVEELTEKVRKRANHKNISNIKTFNHIEQFIGNYDKSESDVILTEVVEHMPYEQSVELVKTVVDKIKFNKFIITVPNKEFNQFYLLGEDEFRHHDHDWEPTSLEFLKFIDETIGDKFNKQFVSIGDTIDGISTSIGCIVSTN